MSLAFLWRIQDSCPVCSVLIVSSWLDAGSHFWQQGAAADVVYLLWYTCCGNMAESTQWQAASLLMAPVGQVMIARPLH